MAKRVDNAIVQRNIPALLAYFADDATIQADWLAAEGMTKKKFTRQKFGDDVKGQFPGVTLRERTHSTTKITIPGDGKAACTSEVKDTVTTHGMTVSVPTVEAMELVQRGNQLLITSLDMSLPTTRARCPRPTLLLRRP